MSAVEINICCYKRLKIDCFDACAKSMGSISECEETTINCDVKKESVLCLVTLFCSSEPQHFQARGGEKKHIHVHSH